MNSRSLIHPQSRRTDPGRLRSLRYVRQGFTLIEMVGVLAVMTILSVTLLVPSVIREVDQAAKAREIADLNKMTEALVQGISRSHTVPDAAGMPGVIAGELALPISVIQTTPRGFSRVFLADPAFRVGSSGLPYLQNTSGAATLPTGTRLMIVSSWNQALPLSNGTLSTADFDSLWNTPPDAIPSSWTSWTGTPQDLCIKRVNLASSFHCLNLVNPNGAPKFFVDQGTPVNVPVGGWTAYYLDQTVVNLCDPNGQTMLKYILVHDVNFAFVNGSWQGQLDTFSAAYP
jgi:prepilin-type N-terminal cleavage/methylation domain-containing protein